MLAARLEAEFPEIEVVGQVGVRDVPETATGRVDAIVSTVDLDGVDGVEVPVLRVRPFLDEGDVRRVRTWLRAERTVLRGTRVTEDVELLRSRLGGGDAAPSPERRGALARYLGEDVIAIGVEAETRAAAITAAGQLLVRAGCCEPRYVDGMVAMVESLGPYVVVAPGIALPHARPQDGARAEGLAFVRLSKPVAFGNREFDPVDLLFAFAARDADLHLAVMAELADFLRHPGNASALRAAPSVEACAAIFAGAQQ
jgi:PTS system ascorbate-specific IIA component